MQIRFHCPADRCVAIIEYEPLETSGPTMECPRCHLAHDITVTDSMRDEDVVDQCAVCGCREMFIRKDFPQMLGFGIVVVFGLLALYAFTISPLYAFAILATAVVIDLIIYKLIGRCTACYACRAEYRKCHFNPAHEGFDLSTSEKY